MIVLTVIETPDKISPAKFRIILLLSHDKRIELGGVETVHSSLKK